MHGVSMIEHIIIPIGQMSEEALESRNKDVRKFRTGNIRKISRITTNLDLFHRLLETSDPLISSKREMSQNPKKPFHPDARFLLDMGDTDEGSDAASESD